MKYATTAYVKKKITDPNDGGDDIIVIPPDNPVPQQSTTPQCKENSDCGSGQVCDNGVCKEITDQNDDDDVIVIPPDNPDPQQSTTPPATQNQAEDPIAGNDVISGDQIYGLVFAKTTPGSDVFPDRFSVIIQDSNGAYISQPVSSITTINEQINSSFQDFQNSKITNCITLDYRWTNKTANCYKDKKMYIYNASVLCPKPGASLTIKRRSTNYYIYNTTDKKIARIEHSIYLSKDDTSQDIRYENGAQNIFGYNVSRSGGHTYDTCNITDISYTDIIQIWPDPNASLTADMLSQNFQVINFTFAEKTEYSTTQQTEQPAAQQSGSTTPQCKTDSDCGSGQVCDNGVCKQKPVANPPSSQNSGTTCFTKDTSGAKRYIPPVNKTGRRYFWIGDSRFTGMYINGIIGRKNNEAVIAHAGRGHQWFTQTPPPTGISLLESCLQNGDVVILNLGANDTWQPDKYISTYRSLMSKHPGVTFKIVSVNPVYDGKARLKNAKVEEFNKKLHDAFPGNYIDTYSVVKSLVTAATTDAEGLHYTGGGIEKKIYDTVMSSIGG